MATTRVLGLDFDPRGLGVGGAKLIKILIFDIDLDTYEETGITGQRQHFNMVIKTPEETSEVPGQATIDEGDGTYSLNRNWPIAGQHEIVVTYDPPGNTGVLTSSIKFSIDP